MTGSPKPYGFKTKEDFVKLIGDNGYVQGPLNEKCKILITDDINSNSSKMSKAKKLGVEIMTYEDILNKIKNI
jgi:NAD-dependent DNA ligase